MHGWDLFNGKYYRTQLVACTSNGENHVSPILQSFSQITKMVLVSCLITG